MGEAAAYCEKNSSKCFSEKAANSSYVSRATSLPAMHEVCQAAMDAEIHMCCTMHSHVITTCIACFFVRLETTKVVQSLKCDEVAVCLS